MSDQKSNDLESGARWWMSDEQYEAWEEAYKHTLAGQLAEFQRSWQVVVIMPVLHLATAILAAINRVLRAFDPYR
jgi:hypothetical protein